MSRYALGLATPQTNIAGSAWIAPTAQTIGNVIIGHEASIWFSVVVRGDNETIRIGDRVNIQDSRSCIAIRNFRFTSEMTPR
jgi:carbonic anhydrase/acetyltransferase-like protein (isoleucine patch superfamily)